MFQYPTCDMYFNTECGSQMHTVEVHACLDQPIACEVIETNNSEVSGCGWKQSDNLSIWDTPRLEETGIILF